MNMAGEQRIAAPRARVWEALNDPGILRASIPGCQSLEKVADDRFTATVEVKVGPIGARFKGAVSLADLDPPYGYTLILDGNGGIAGSARGSAKVRLSEDAGNTRVAWDIDVQVGGRMAQLGGPIIDATAKQLAGTLSNCGPTKSRRCCWPWTNSSSSGSSPGGTGLRRELRQRPSPPGRHREQAVRRDVRQCG